MMHSHFDIIVCGGGHVGSCLALALAQQKIKVALIDSLSASTRKSTADNRVFALAATSRTFLEQLAIWPGLQPHTTAIKHIHVSNQGSFGAARLHAKDFALEALGYMTPSTALQQALNHALQQVDITLFSPATLDTFTTHPDHVAVKISSTQGTQQLSAQWLIGADGANSFVRQHAGILLTMKDYQQQALVTVIDLETSHHFTAYERFGNDGVIALLPHTPWQSVLIWSAKNSLIDSLMSLDEHSFLNKLQQAFGFRLGKFSSLSPRISYPLQQTQADRIHAARLLLIGNAAQTLHPVAAQGFNLTLRHVALLAHLLKKTRDRDKVHFTQTLLDEYAQRQAIDTIKTLHFTDHLVNFSSSSHRCHRFARTLMINVLGASSLAQHYLLHN